MMTTHSLARQYRAGILPLIAFFTLISLAVSIRPANAQLAVTIDNPNVNVVQGQTVYFDATITNTSTTDTYNISAVGIDDSFINWNVPGYFATSDFGVIAPSFATYPGGYYMLYFTPGATYTGPVGYFGIPGNAIPATYTAFSNFFDIQGSDVTTNSRFDTSTGYNDTITVNAVPLVPESSSLALAFAAGVALCSFGLFGILRRRRGCSVA